MLRSVHRAVRQHEPRVSSGFSLSAQGALAAAGLFLLIGVAMSGQIQGAQSSRIEPVVGRQSYPFTLSGTQRCMRLGLRRQQRPWAQPLLVCLTQKLLH